MNANDPLADLADIAVKEGVSWWPLAIGWWLVITITALLVVAGGIYLWRRIQQQRPQKDVISRLMLLHQQPDLNAVAIGSATLLKHYLGQYRPEFAQYSLDQLAAQLETQGIALTNQSAEFLDALFIACYQRPATGCTERLDPDVQALGLNQSSNEINSALGVDAMVASAINLIKELPPKKLILREEAEHV